MAPKKIGIGDYVEVNGMWGYVNWIDGDMVRVNVDREDGSRETVTYHIDEIDDDDHDLSSWVDCDESGLMEALKYAGITDPDDRPRESEPLTSFIKDLDTLLKSAGSDNN